MDSVLLSAAPIKGAGVLREQDAVAAVRDGQRPAWSLSGAGITCQSQKAEARDL